MSVILASVGAMLLSCGGTQSSAPLWEDEPVQFRLSIEGGDFAVPSGSLNWELEDRDIVNSADGGTLLTGTIKGNPRASFMAEMTRDGEGRTLNWRVTEITSNDGRSTLQVKGNVTCKADKQVNAL